MKNSLLVSLLFFAVFQGCEKSEISTVSQKSNENIKQLSSSDSTNENSSSKNSLDNRINEQPKYLGCWSGMRGGRLKITKDKIYDLGSQEQSSYKEGKINRNDVNTGMQSGEKYLLEASNDFPKSFLAKTIEFSFNTDETVGVTTYHSYENYLNDKFVGIGLFEKVLCEKIK